MGLGVVTFTLQKEEVEEEEDMVEGVGITMVVVMEGLTTTRLIDRTSSRHCNISMERT